MSRARWIGTAAAVAIGLAWPTVRVGQSLVKTRGGVATFTRLIGAANAGDLEAVRSQCSRRYLDTHPIERSREGGVVGLPRGIHRNFRVWVEGADVWLCPTNRIGPVYRIVLEEDRWKFDGPVGLLRAGGTVEPAEESMMGDP